MTVITSKKKKWLLRQKISPEDLEKMKKDFLDKGNQIEKIEDLSSQVKSIKEASAFYNSSEWKECREEFIKSSNLKCVACDADFSENHKLDGMHLCVDHIESLRWNWHLRLEKTNLQILCNLCNKVKGNKSMEEIWG